MNSRPQAWLPSPQEQDAAISLLREAGHDPLMDISPLLGGRNSRTFLLVDQSGRESVMKLYPTTHANGHPRRQAEMDFLELCQVKGISAVPRILATDDCHHASLFSRVPGCSFTELGRTPTSQEVEQLADFIGCLNSPPRAQPRLRPAAEACFSIGEHLRLVEVRVERLMRMDDLTDVHRAAGEWSRDVLVPAWRSLRGTVAREIPSTKLEAQLDTGQICVSPSDVGFHNVVIDAGSRLYFVDFEYAGFDDPAKLVSDALLQPRVPLSNDLSALLRARMCAALELSSDLIQRIDVLMPVYTIKWACIVLNVFVPTPPGSGNRANALPSEEEMLSQLTLAQRLLARRDT